MSTRRVLLTGAYSLTGLHILDQLLSANVSIRAVVGSREEVQALGQLFPHTDPHSLDFAIVFARDLAIPGALDEALTAYPDRFDTVIHAVAANPSDEADCLARFINLETDTLTNLLRSIKDVTSSVQRVIIITSLTPFARWLVDPQYQRSPVAGNPAHPRASEIDSEYVLATSQASDNIVYEALSRWMKEAHVRFDLVYVTAPSVYGPSIRPLETSSDLVEANRRIWNICSNDSHERVNTPPYGIDYFTDVRDLALACIQAVFVSQANNKRFVVSAGTMPSSSAIANFLVSRFPELADRVQAGDSPPRRPPSGSPSLEFSDTHLAASILGMVRYRTVEETLTDLAQQILELHRRKEWKRVIQS